MASSSCRTISIESLEGRLESADPEENLADLFLPLLEQSSEPKSIKRIELSEYNGKGDRKKKRLQKFEHYGKKHLVEIAPLKAKHRNKKTPLAIIVTAPGISKTRNWKNRNREYKEYTGSNFSLEDFFRKTPDSRSEESGEKSIEVTEENEGSHLKSEKRSEEHVLKNAYYNSGDESVEGKGHKHKTKHTDSSDTEESKDVSELDNEGTNDTIESEDKKSRRRISSESKRSEGSDDESDDINSTVETENLVKKEVTSEIVSAEKKSKETESQSVSVEYSEKSSEVDEIENKEKDTSENETQETGTNKDKISENSEQQPAKKESSENEEDISANDSIIEKHKIKILEKSSSDSGSNDDKENHVKDENKHSDSKIESIQVGYVYESSQKILKDSQEHIKEAYEHDSSEYLSHENPKKTVYHFTKTSEEHNAEDISNDNSNVSTDNIKKHHIIKNKLDADDVSNVYKSIKNHSQKEKSDQDVRNSSTDESSNDTSEEKLDGIIDEAEVSTDDYSTYKERLAVPKDESAASVDKTPFENLSDDHLKPKIYEILNLDDKIDESKLVEVKDSISDIDSDQDSVALEHKDLSYLGYEPLSDSASEHTDNNIQKNENNRIGDWTFEVNSSDESKTEFKIDSESTEEEDCDDSKNKPDITVKESVQTIVKPRKGSRLKTNNNHDGYGEERLQTNSKANENKNKASDLEKKSVSYNTNKSYKLSFLFNK